MPIIEQINFKDCKTSKFWFRCKQLPTCPFSVTGWVPLNLARFTTLRSILDSTQNNAVLQMINSTNKIQTPHLQPKPVLLRANCLHVTLKIIQVMIVSHIATTGLILCSKANTTVLGGPMSKANSLRLIQWIASMADFKRTQFPQLSQAYQQPIRGYQYGINLQRNQLF